MGRQQTSGRSSSGANPTLQNVKWRFLSDAALGPQRTAQSYPDDSKKRISHLEKALASTHDLEAQYQSFLNEVSKIDPSGTTFDGIGPGWAGMPSMAGGGEQGGLVKADIIPSDPDDGLPITRSGKLSSSTEALSTAPEASQQMEDGSGAPSAAGGSGGEFAAEDDEVARVQKLASQAAMDDVDAPVRDSPSPVIIWRHAAPVKIATNVPADLLVGPDRGGQGQGRPRLNAPAPSSLPHGRYVNPARASFDRRMAYGVWYLPKEQWERRAQAAGQGGLAAAALLTPGAPPSSGGTGSSGGGGEAGAGASASFNKGGRRGKDGGKDVKGGDGGEETDGQSLADQIPTLYSSRIYKDFLKAQKVPAARIPPYLQRVESPKAQLSSRRGNIPLIRGEGGEGAAEAGGEP